MLPAPAMLTVTVPAGALVGRDRFRLTALSPQGLPGLLPLGLQPHRSHSTCEVRPSAPPHRRASAGLPALTLHLVTYNRTLHAWTLSDRLAAADGWRARSPAPGHRRLGARRCGSHRSAAGACPRRAARSPAPPFQAIPAGVSGETLTEPEALPVMGGASRVRVTVTSAALPSGTVVQTVVSETFTLAAGGAQSTEPRLEDLVLYRADIDGLLSADPGSVTAHGAELPVVASRPFQPTEVTAGVVQLKVRGRPRGDAEDRRQRARHA